MIVSSLGKKGECRSCCATVVDAYLACRVTVCYGVTVTVTQSLKKAMLDSKQLPIQKANLLLEPPLWQRSEEFGDKFQEAHQFVVQVVGIPSED